MRALLYRGYNLSILNPVDGTISLWLRTKIIRHPVRIELTDNDLLILLVKHFTDFLYGQRGRLNTYLCGSSIDVQTHNGSNGLWSYLSNHCSTMLCSKKMFRNGANWVCESRPISIFHWKSRFWHLNLRPLLSMHRVTMQPNPRDLYVDPVPML